MADNIFCQHLTNLIKKLSKSKVDFDFIIDQQPINIQEALSLHDKIKIEIGEVLEYFWPFENLPKDEFKGIINDQISLMTDRGMIGDYNGVRGILGEGGQICPIPSVEQMNAVILEKREKLAEKFKQGFTQPLLVPFGLNLEDMASRVGSYVADLKAQGLIADDVNTEEVFLSWTGEQFHQSLEVSAVYYPTSFDVANHGGKTKSEVESESAFPGWQILMVEPLWELPQTDDCETIGGRTQLDPTGKAFGKEFGKIWNGQSIPSFSEWMEELSKSATYQNEIGFTYESWLIFYLYSLEKNKQITEKYKAGNSGSLLLGTYYPKGNYIAAGHWNENAKSIECYRYDNGGRNNEHVPRTAVRIA